MLLFPVLAEAATYTIPWIGTNTWRTNDTFWPLDGSDHSGGVYPWQQWQAVETNFATLQGEITAIQGGMADAQTNAMLNSQRVAAWSTNGISLAAGATNAPVWVTNLAGVTYTAILGTPQLLFSYDGSNYVAGSVTLITNTRVRVMFYSGSAIATNSFDLTAIPMPGAVTNVTYWRLARPDLFGCTNALYGEKLVLGEPKSPSEAATKNYVDTTFATTRWWSAIQDVQLNAYTLHYNVGWTEYVGGNQGTVLHWSFLNKDAFTVNYTPATTVTNTLTAAVDGTGTNVVVSVLTNGISSSVRLMFSHTVSPLNWQLSDSAPTLTGNAWVFTVPFPWQDAGFCTATIPSSNPGVIALNTVLQLTPRTITNATSTTWGYGSGIVCADTNYVYVSVGTNSWKRAALSAW